MRMFAGLSVLASLAAFGLPGVAASHAPAADVTPFAVRPPSVTGPIPSTPADYPFIADGFGPVSALAPVGCTHQQFVDGPSVGMPGVVDPNTYPFSNVANAAFADLTRWVDDGVPPPHAPRIEVSSTGAIERDNSGNALGGLRTPFVDVPTATYTPADTVAHATAFSGFCILYGYNTPFSQAMLKSLYKNHGQYVALVRHESNRLVREGFWLRPDAQDVIKQAAQSDVP